MSSEDERLGQESDSNTSMSSVGSIPRRGRARRRASMWMSVGGRDFFYSIDSNDPAWNEFCQSRNGPKGALPTLTAEDVEGAAAGADAPAPSVDDEPASAPSVDDEPDSAPSVDDEPSSATSEDDGPAAKRPRN